MKSIEKPLTIILIAAFIALIYLWQTQQIGDHTIQVVEPEVKIAYIETHYDTITVWTIDDEGYETGDMEVIVKEVVDTVWVTP